MAFFNKTLMKQKHFMQIWTSFLTEYAVRLCFLQWLSGASVFRRAGIMICFWEKLIPGDNWNWQATPHGCKRFMKGSALPCSPHWYMCQYEEGSEWTWDCLRVLQFSAHWHNSSKNFVSTPFALKWVSLGLKIKFGEDSLKSQIRISLFPWNPWIRTVIFFLKLHMENFFSLLDVDFNRMPPWRKLDQYWSENRLISTVTTPLYPFAGMCGPQEEEFIGKSWLLSSHIPDLTDLKVDIKNQRHCTGWQHHMFPFKAFFQWQFLLPPWRGVSQTCTSVTTVRFLSYVFVFLTNPTLNSLLKDLSFSKPVLPFPCANCGVWCQYLVLEVFFFMSASVFGPRDTCVNFNTARQLMGDATLEASAIFQQAQRLYLATLFWNVWVTVWVTVISDFYGAGAISIGGNWDTSSLNLMADMRHPSSVWMVLFNAKETDDSGMNLSHSTVNGWPASLAKTDCQWSEPTLDE